MNVISCADSEFCNFWIAAKEIDIDGSSISSDMKKLLPVMIRPKK